MVYPAVIFPINYNALNRLAVSTTINQSTFYIENSNFLIIPLSIQNGNGFKDMEIYKNLVEI
jgi:hypothetical protein